MNQPLVSIIIPFYNVAPYIKRCLDSVLNQTYINYEVLLINDKTPDNSQEIVDKFLLENKESASKFRVVKHIENKGLSGARNTGIEEAKGDYLFFIDSDDYIDSKCIENHVKIITKEQADVTFGSYHKFKEGGEIEMTLALGTMEGSATGIEQLTKKNPFFYYYVNAWNKLFKKSFIKENNLQFEERLFAEDLMFLFMVLTKDQKVAFASEAYYYYYLGNTSSIMNNLSEKSLKDYQYIINKMVSTTNELYSNNKFKLLNFRKFINYYIIDAYKNTSESQDLKGNIKTETLSNLKKKFNPDYYSLVVENDRRTLKRYLKFQFPIVNRFIK